MVWSVEDLRAFPAVDVAPAEVVYMYVSLAGEPAAGDEELLDETERIRSRGFVRLADSRRFVLAHAALRLLLGGCAGIDPAQVSYELGPHGKPELAGSAPALRFNLSHSGDLALIAVARSLAVGVDVEQVRELEEIAGITAERLSAAESEELRALPPGEQLDAFFRWWTRKEAVLKLAGQGLGLPLDRFEVELAPGSLSALRRYEGRPGDEVDASLRDLSPPPGYVAAGAVAAPIRERISWREL